MVTAWRERLITAPKPVQNAWACMDPGRNHQHWAGDPQCGKPGAGLGRKKAVGNARQVKVVEAYNTEHIVGGPHEVAMAQRDDGAEHEVSMVQLDRGMTLKEALWNS